MTQSNHYLHIFENKANPSMLLFGAMTNTRDDWGFEERPDPNEWKEIVTLTCYDRKRLESLTIVEAAKLIGDFELEKYAEKDIMELGTWEHPPEIISMDYIRSLVRGVSYQSQGLSTICNLETVSGFQIVGQSHSQTGLKYSSTLGREFALDDAMKQLFQLEVYRSSVYHNLLKK